MDYAKPITVEFDHFDRFDPTGVMGPKGLTGSFADDYNSFPIKWQKCVSIPARSNTGLNIARIGCQSDGYDSLARTWEKCLVSICESSVKNKAARWQKAWTKAFRIADIYVPPNMGKKHASICHRGQRASFRPTIINRLPRFYISILDVQLWSTSAGYHVFDWPKQFLRDLQRVEYHDLVAELSTKPTVNHYYAKFKDLIPLLSLDQSAVPDVAVWSNSLHPYRVFKWNKWMLFHNQFDNTCLLLKHSGFDGYIVWSRTGYQMERLYIQTLTDKDVQVRRVYLTTWSKSVVWEENGAYKYEETFDSRMFHNPDLLDAQVSDWIASVEQELNVIASQSWLSKQSKSVRQCLNDPSVHRPIVTIGMIKSQYWWVTAIDRQRGAVLEPVCTAASVRRLIMELADEMDDHDQLTAAVDLSINFLLSVWLNGVKHSYAMLHLVLQYADLFAPLQTTCSPLHRLTKVLVHQCPVCQAPSTAALSRRLKYRRSHDDRGPLQWLPANERRTVPDWSNLFFQDPNVITGKTVNDLIKIHQLEHINVDEFMAIVDRTIIHPGRAPFVAKRIVFSDKSYVQTIYEQPGLWIVDQPFTHVVPFTATDTLNVVPRQKLHHVGTYIIPRQKKRDQKQDQKQDQKDDQFDKGFLPLFESLIAENKICAAIDLVTKHVQSVRRYAPKLCATTRKKLDDCYDIGMISTDEWTRLTRIFEHAEVEELARTRSFSEYPTDSTDSTDYIDTSSRSTFNNKFDNKFLGQNCARDAIDDIVASVKCPVSHYSYSRSLNVNEPSWNWVKSEAQLQRFYGQPSSGPGREEWCILRTGSDVIVQYAALDRYRVCQKRITKTYSPDDITVIRRYGGDQSKPKPKPQSYTEEEEDGADPTEMVPLLPGSSTKSKSSVTEKDGKTVLRENGKKIYDRDHKSGKTSVDQLSHPIVDSKSEGVVGHKVARPYVRQRVDEELFMMELMEAIPSLFAFSYTIAGPGGPNIDDNEFLDPYESMRENPTYSLAKMIRSYLILLPYTHQWRVIENEIVVVKVQNAADAKMVMPIGQTFFQEYKKERSNKYKPEEIQKPVFNQEIAATHDCKYHGYQLTGDEIPQIKAVSFLAPVGSPITIHAVGEWLESEIDLDPLKECAKGLHFYRDRDAVFKRWIKPNDTLPPCQCHKKF